MHWPVDTSKMPEIIDFFVVKGILSNYIHVEENYDLMGYCVVKQVPQTVFLMNKKTDWEGFREDLEHLVNT